jgi:predicted RNA-binding protein
LKKSYIAVSFVRNLAGEEKKTVCEFRVIKEGKTVYKDGVYAKVEGTSVTVKDVLGVSKVFDNCMIVEVDVGSERLVLSPTKGFQGSS